MIIRFGIPKRSASPAFCPNPVARSSIRVLAPVFSRFLASSMASVR
jgi:hypothetical protein